MYKKIINRLSKEENIFRWIFFWRTYFEKSNSRVHYIIGKGSHGSALGNFPLNEHKPFLQTFFQKWKRNFLVSNHKAENSFQLSAFKFQTFLVKPSKRAGTYNSINGNVKNYFWKLFNSNSNSVSVFYYVCHFWDSFLRPQTLIWASFNFSEVLLQHISKCF